VSWDVGQSDINEGDFQHFEPMQDVQESRISIGQFANNRQLQPLQGVQEIPQRISGFQSSVDDGHLRMDGGQSSVDWGHLKMDEGQPSVSRGQSSLDGGQRSFKDAYLYDGRLLYLTQDVIENLRTENKVEIGSGSFGKVYKSEYKNSSLYKGLFINA
jgi:hypothetical protein